MKKFNNFILESLILEYQFYFNPDVVRFLSKTDDPVASELQNIIGKDNKDIDINGVDFGDKEGDLEYRLDKKVDRGMLKYYDWMNGMEEEQQKRYFNDSFRRKYTDLLATIPTVSSKMGRTVQKILKLSDKKFKTKDIEDFVNKAIAYQKSLKGVDFDIYKGNKIIQGYKTNNYANRSGNNELFNSCMNDESDYLKLYTENPDVCSLLVLKDNEGKIIGRSFLWEAYYKGRYIKVMDRVYTIKQSDEQIFRNWAKENGYYCRKINNNNDEENRAIMVSPTGEEENMWGMTVTFKNCMFSYYPYVDTFKYMDRSTGKATNDSDVLSRYIEMDSTGGEYTGDDGHELVETVGGIDLPKDECIWSNYHVGYIEIDKATEVWHGKDKAYVSYYVDLEHVGEEDIIEIGKKYKEKINLYSILFKYKDELYDSYGVKWNDISKKYKWSK